MISKNVNFFTTYNIEKNYNIYNQEASKYCHDYCTLFSKLSDNGYNIFNNFKYCLKSKTITDYNGLSMQ